MNSHILVLINTCSLMAFCTMAYSYAQANVPLKILRRCIVGLIFGFSSIITMIQPIEIETGIFADARGAFIGMATAFGGPLAALIAVTLAIFGRLVLGGTGEFIGIIVIIITSGCSGLWLYIYKNYQERNTLAWFFLTLACAMPSFIALNAISGTHTWISIFLAGLTAITIFIFGKLMNAEQCRGRRERKLAHAASTDVLTGLPNRRAFDEHARQLEKSGVDDIMLLLLDVDHFKSINDELGHKAGDVVLQEISKKIRSTIRDTDFAARIGGEEFAVIVHTRGRASGYQIAERFRQNVQVLYGPLENRRISTISIGGFCFNGKPFSYVNGYKQADDALYHSKRAGRNRTTLSPALDAA